MQYREGEKSGESVTQVRTDRFYCIFDQWFFTSRESLRHGPYASRDEAELALMAYLRHVNEGGIYAALPTADRPRESGFSCP